MNDLFATGSPAIQRSAVFSHNRTYRREIRRWWVPAPTRWAAWLMVNPSKAGADRDDPTALRVTDFTRRWGYDGWIGVNLGPLVASNPADFWQWFDWESRGPDWHARDVLHANLADIERVGRMAALRVVAFGNAAERAGLWVEECLEAFGQPNGGDETLYCIGTTLSGAPKHPLARGVHRVPSDQRPIIWSRE